MEVVEVDDEVGSGVLEVDEAEVVLDMAVVTVGLSVVVDSGLPWLLGLDVTVSDVLFVVLGSSEAVIVELAVDVVVGNANSIATLKSVVKP